MKYLEFNEVFGLIYHYMYFRFANISHILPPIHLCGFLIDLLVFVYYKQ